MVNVAVGSERERVEGRRGPEGAPAHLGFGEGDGEVGRWPLTPESSPECVQTEEETRSMSTT